MNIRVESVCHHSVVGRLGGSMLTAHKSARNPRHRERVFVLLPCSHAAPIRMLTHRKVFHRSERSVVLVLNAGDDIVGALGIYVRHRSGRLPPATVVDELTTACMYIIHCPQTVVNGRPTTVLS